ncbi:MAG: ParB/RepB/Spo0J family partition protein [Myxococcota bacterium]
MTARRTALGRGLGALIPGAGPPSAQPVAPVPDQEDVAGAEAVPDVATGPTRIPVDLIDPNPEQPRRVFDGEQLEHLADSVRRHGILQPVVVRRAGDRYELVVGERRFRAARAAGLETIPAVVSDIETRDRLEIAIVENVQRHDLNPIELAHAYRALAESGHTQEEIGARVGLDRSSVANHLRLLELSRDVQEDVESGRITMGHAKALLQLGNPERRRHLRDRIVAEGWSVREAEQRGRAMAGPGTGKRKRPAKAAAAEALGPEWQDLQDRIRDRLQTRVRFAGTEKRGRIEIEYFSAEDLERLATALLEGPGR